jgi:hypothetical protein
MPPKKGTSTPNKPPENPTWTLDEGEEMRRAECVVCQQNKVETIKTPCILQPLSIPSQRWEEVSMDFITGLPKSEGKSVIMVIVDRPTKYAHFCALSHPFKASTVATAFMETVQKLHGSPKIIVSDRDPIFTGHFWT